MDADLCIKIRVQRGWPTAGGEGELLIVDVILSSTSCSFLPDILVTINSMIIQW